MEEARPPATEAVERREVEEPLAGIRSVHRHAG